MKKNLTIGFVIHHYRDMFGTFSAMEKIRGAKDAAFKENVDLLIHIAKKGKELNYRGIDGILFADLFENEKLVDKARKLKIPYVILEYFDAKGPLNCIGIDNKGAAVDVVSAFVRLGHRKIAIITGKLGAKIGQDRLDGYYHGLKKNHLELKKDYIVNGDWTKEGGEKAFKKLLKCKNLPTAIFVAGDEMAVGVMEEAGKRNIRIPEDISIIGFDDIPSSSGETVSLSTVRQPLYEMGKLGVKYLKEIINKTRKTPFKFLLRDADVILRKTVRKLKTS